MRHRCSDLLKENLKRITPEEMLNHGIISPARNGGYICPVCGNGSGDDGTGIKPGIDGGNFIYHCFKCNESADNIRLLAKHYRLDEKADFKEIVRRGAEEFNLSADVEYIPVKDSREEITHEGKRIISAEELKIIIADDVQKAPEHLPAFIEQCGGKFRGLTLETLHHFLCGYFSSWAHPKKILKGGYVTPSRRLIIPTSERHYIAVAVDRDKVEKKYWKQHAGEKELFNPAALTGELILVVEGEIDAMSIWQVGFKNTVASGGAGNFKTLLTELGKRNIQPGTKQFIILFDNDDAGRKNSADLETALREKGFASIVAFIQEGYDANKILQEGGELILKNEIEKIIETSAPELEKIENEFSDERAREEKISDWSADNGEINPDVLPKIKSAEEFLNSLTVENITASTIKSSKAIRAAGLCRYYDFAGDAAEHFQNVVKKAVIIAKNAISKDATGAEEKFYSLSGVQSSVLETEIKSAVSRARKEHAQYKKKLQAEKDAKEIKRRQETAKRIRLENIRRLEELSTDETDDERKISAQIELIKDSLDWKLDKYGNLESVKATQDNIDLIFERDPNIANIVGYDEFQQCDVLLKKPVWRKSWKRFEMWTDRDDSELRRYLDKTYTGLTHKDKIFDNVIHYSMQNSFHEVKQYLENLPSWDGTPRAETFFIDFLKVPDSPYSREVTLNFLFGALARIYYPGCEFQTALVLQGKQGIGKSHVLHELGGKWYVSLRDNLDDSHAVDTIQQAWVCELEEFKAARKTEVNALKAFVSARDDTRRAAYDRRAKKVARHCVFAVTVNDDQFLRDRTGNRRFVILQCGCAQNEIARELTTEYVQQVWAEVFEKFNAMFADGFDERKLRLSHETMIQAAELADEHLQDDALDAEVAAFVERKIPAAPVWDLMTIPERRKFFEQSHIEIGAEELKNRAKANPRKHDIEKLNAVLNETKTITANGTVFYGTEYRKHICAAELNLECFALTDRRKNMIRLNEVLANLDGWQKGKPIYRDTCFGTQKNVYWRIEAEGGSVDQNGAEIFDVEEISSDDLPFVAE